MTEVEKMDVLIFGRIFRGCGGILVPRNDRADAMMQDDKGVNSQMSL